jgi:hypothetical protein
MPRFKVFTTLSTLLCALIAGMVEAKAWSAGPLYDEFRLTLAPGWRAEALGPFLNWGVEESQRHFGLSPVFFYGNHPELDRTEMDFLYPLLTYDRFGSEYRFQIAQWFSFSGGGRQDSTTTRRFTLFPFYFQQRSPDPELNYTAFFPFYGRLQNRFFRDEIYFVMFPAYSQTRRRDVVTDNYLYPIFHIRRGNELEGWQVWPLYGQEERRVTTRTNIMDELEIVPGHRKMFALWPLYFQQTAGIGTENESRHYGSIPLFSVFLSPERDSITAPWPLGITYTDDRTRKFREWGAPWPLIVFSRGEGKYMTRIWPIYSRAESESLQSAFVLWPIYRYNRLEAPSVERERTRILFFLYSDIHEKNLETGASRRRIDFWPLFTSRRDLNGDTRLQVLAPLEPFLPQSKSVERNYSPVWSVWRSERNAETGDNSQSLLWNLYRREERAEAKKCSFLFGLFKYESSSAGKRLRLFYVPVYRTKEPLGEGRWQE